MTPTPEQLQTCWNENRGEMLEWRGMISDRRQRAISRLAETPDLARWATAIRRAADSPFCTGQIVTDAGAEPFIANADWLLKPETLILIEEGQFDSRRIQPPPTQAVEKVTPYFNLEKDTRRLLPEELRRLRLCGLAIRAWERERKVHYDDHGMARDKLVAWAFSPNPDPPPLVRLYGPPHDSSIAQLETWMYQHGTNWPRP